jgi:hypothetical protein
MALKILPPELTACRERLDRFQREAEAPAILDHPDGEGTSATRQGRPRHLCRDSG